MKKTRKLTESEEARLANIIAVALIVVIVIGIAMVTPISNAITNMKEKKLQQKFDYAYENSALYLPDGYYLKLDDSTENYLANLLSDNSKTDKYKEELLDYLEKQNYSIANLTAYVENTGKSDDNVVDTNDLNSADDTETTESANENKVQVVDDNGNVVEVDEATQNLVNSIDEAIKNGTDNEISSTTNTKKAKSYKTLADAESAFGSNLGLYTYVDALENYEMISAYIIEDEFMQCVYAKNQDGTKITDDEDIETADITSIAVKYSKTVKSEELIKVYKEYDVTYDKSYNGNVVHFGGSEVGKVNIAYMDLNNGRNYTIHSADPLDSSVMENVVGELIGNLAKGA